MIVVVYFTVTTTLLYVHVACNPVASTFNAIVMKMHGGTDKPRVN